MRHLSVTDPLEARGIRQERLFLTILSFAVTRLGRMLVVLVELSVMPHPGTSGMRI
jgi:hypothetical protein